MSNRAMFPAITDRATRVALEQWGTSVESRLPWSKFQFVDVTFTAPDTDVDIAHTLAPADANRVRWVVVSTTRDIIVYRDASGTAKTWTPTTCWLRANDSATVRLFLFLESE